MCISNLGKCKYSHGQWKFYATKQTFIKSLILLEKAHISLSWLLARNNLLLYLLTTYLKKKSKFKSHKIVKLSLLLTVWAQQQIYAQIHSPCTLHWGLSSMLHLIVLWMIFFSEATFLKPTPSTPLMVFLELFMHFNYKM